MERMTIGPPECPIMKRLTIVRHRRFGSLRLHLFMPNADDRDVHDHPWPFLTLVVSGWYDDMKNDGEGIVLRERMSRGKVRYRSATHQHRTRVGPDGCLTVVVTGPVVRGWGFLRDGRWIPWRRYEALHGWGMRCDDERDVSFARAFPRKGGQT
jgi:hypothetical protein